MIEDLEALGRAVKRVQDRDHRALDAAMRATGISLVQWDALRAVDASPGASAHELALASFQSDQAFGTLAARLEAAGWIERRPGAGRRIEHRLNDRGRAALAAGREAAAPVWQRLFGALDETEAAALLALLGRLLDEPAG